MHATSGERGLQSHASGAARPRATQLPEPPPGSATAGPGDEEEANPALELRDSDENINTQSWEASSKQMWLQGFSEHICKTVLQDYTNRYSRSKNTHVLFVNPCWVRPTGQSSALNPALDDSLKAWDLV
ncbi:hypothetical protein Anapl_03776 [Anas platyrhynchos]|uniref:Uncharacterized protein n=1 Tax=Anas platyrhynchos TaxID=8839 RepID=R0M0R6_ANAPL|nr:hypothetical protein Anapl_03776 [Anas platyrhynchos]